MAARFLIGNRCAYQFPTTPIIAIRAPYRSHHTLFPFKGSNLRLSKRQSASPCSVHRILSNPLSTITNTSRRPDNEMSEFYDLKAEKPNGTTLNFSELKGKVVLIVNVASQCGFTKQYTGLQALYDKYKEKDFVIVGFPSNQFGGQEPGTDEEIAQFCTLNHGVTFPLVKKSDVNGDNTNETYKWLKSQKAGLLGLTRIKWNFEKWLIDREGQVVNRWASTTTPEAIDKEVAAIL